MLQYLSEFPFFLRLSSISILHIYPRLFIHLGIDWYYDRFWLLSIVITTAVGTDIQIYVLSLLSFLLNIYLEVNC